MAPTLLQVGVLGTAAIARKNILAIRESGSLQVRAVASRTLQRAQEFAEETGRRAGLAG
jgi:predicted dehydrogenase